MTYQDPNATLREGWYVIIRDSDRPVPDPRLTPGAVDEDGASPPKNDA